MWLATGLTLTSSNVIPSEKAIIITIDRLDIACGIRHTGMSKYLESFKCIWTAGKAGWIHEFSICTGNTKKTVKCRDGERRIVNTLGIHDHWTQFSF